MMIIKKDKLRQNNIELLRILSMSMVVMLHLLSFGGLLNTYTTNSIDSFIIWFLESLCFVAVNCFILISGYFLVDSKFKKEKIFKMEAQIVFYSIIIYLIMLITKNITFNKIETLKVIFPTLFGKYWFTTNYIILYILSPYINKLVKNLDKNEYKKLLLILYICFSVWATFISNSNTINYGGGYSISWFIILYIFGAYLKLHYNPDKNKYFYLGIYVSLSLINVIGLFILREINISFISQVYIIIILLQCFQLQFFYLYSFLEYK